MQGILPSSSLPQPRCAYGFASVDTHLACPQASDRFPYQAAPDRDMRPDRTELSPRVT